MAKKKNRRHRQKPDKGPTSIYSDDEGNVLTVRQELSKGTVKTIQEEMVSDAANVDDIWQRRTELLFERLVVSWEISGLPLDDQAMLLGRYRMADSAEKSWVRETLNRHVSTYIPDLDT
ncbi:MAG: hypothetical protein ACSLFI_12130 [Solirubrobacterales bacterium]